MTRHLVAAAILITTGCSGVLGGGPLPLAADAEAAADGSLADAGSERGSSVDHAIALSCDPGFSFEPSAPETGRVMTVIFTSTVEGYAHVALDVTGPGEAQIGALELLSGKSPWKWCYRLTVSAAGLWRFSFTADKGAIIAGRCDRRVIDTGPPPPLEPPPQGDCSDKVCGELDEAGGTCTRCPMVASEGGTCMSPPSPVTPSRSGSWSCLDSASCTSGGQCRIWCPGEPCDSALHPDGCPQGVEACYVSPQTSDYQQACRQCCESRIHAPTGQRACWDSSYNICRYPGDCGKPYPLR